MNQTLEIISGKGELIHATMKDVTGLHRKFWYREGLSFQPLTRMTPEDYPNYFILKDGEKVKFIKSCRQDWEWKTQMAKVYLKQNNLFI